jgi:hypothetical protein
MPYHIEHQGNKYNVVVDATGKVVGSHPSRAKAQAHLGALYANVPDVKKDFATNSGRISGGVGWSIQFNTPDCQHGWSVVKEGTGQSIGCFFKEEDAKAALEALAVTEPVVNKDDASGQVDQDEQEGIGRLSFWNGSFAPVMGLQNGDRGWKSTYNSPPQNDGKPSVGFGNHSDPKGRSNQ